jgi:hypothetical protein
VAADATAAVAGPNGWQAGEPPRRRPASVVDMRALASLLGGQRLMAQHADCAAAMPLLISELRLAVKRGGHAGTGAAIDGSAGHHAAMPEHRRMVVGPGTSVPTREPSAVIASRSGSTGWDAAVRAKRLAAA